MHSTLNTRSLVGTMESRGGMPARCWSIAVTAGPDVGSTISSESGRILVGCEEQCDFVLTDPSVSRRHLELHVAPDGVFVVDLKSKNGTRVGGSRISRAFVRAGGEIRLGHSTLRISVAEEEERETSAQFGDLVTCDKNLRAVLSRFRLVADTDTTVLVSGPVGTGRDLLGRALHANSRRASGPFVTLECGAFRRDERQRLLDAIAQAEGGTVLLEEIGDLAPDLQPEVLALLDAGTDLRVVATTSRDLSELVDARQFSPDLYYRIAVLRAEIPRLSDRPDDIAFLAKHNAKPSPLTRRAIAVLEDYDWPGNDRELRSVVERAVALAGGGCIGPEHLFPEESDGDAECFRDAKERVVADFEQRYARALLGRHDGNVSAAAKAAGLSRHSLYALLKRTGVTAL